MLTIALDPGHPSNDGDTGSVSACGRIVECDYTLHIVRQLRTALQADPIPATPVLLRCRNDEVVAVSERARRATEAGADLVVSVHVDSSVHTSYRGAHVLYWPGNSVGEAVAGQIASSWPAVLRRAGRGSPAHENLWPRARNVLAAYAETAVLAECGYASHPADVDALVEDTVQDQIVGALMQGIRHFRQLRETRWLGGDHAA